MADDDWQLERFYHTIVNARDIDETSRSIKRSASPSCATAGT